MENIETKETEIDDVKKYDRITVQKEALQNALNNAGVDVPFMIQETFLGYKYRKINHKLYREDDDLPLKLIRIYYGLNPDEIRFSNMKKNFISHYVKQESELEAVHCEAERKGLGEMYKYIHNNNMDEIFEEARKSNYFCRNYTSFVLKQLHMKLFTYAPFPELAGSFRKGVAYLDNHVGVQLCEWSRINEEMDKLNGNVEALREMAKNVSSVEDRVAYLDLVMEVMCKLIKIHPFFDGNGRTIRCFINELLEKVNFPPVYIRANEKEAYNIALNLANLKGDYNLIKGFYYYKICDSIIELDINERVRKEDSVYKTKELVLTNKNNNNEGKQ